MGPLPQSPLVRYAVALASIFAATGLRLALEGILKGRFPFATMFLAILFSSWFGGVGPAVLAALIGAVFSALLFMPPHGSLAIEGMEYHGGLVLYLVVSAGIIALGAATRAAQRRAEAQRAQLQATLLHIGDGVIVTDAQGLVTSLNPVAESLTGWQTGEAQRQPLEQVFHIVNEDTRQPVENPATRALREGRIVGLANHTLLIARDGSERSIDDSASPIRDGGTAVRGVVLIFRDVTERRRLERMQKDMLAELERQVAARTAELRASEENFRLLVEGSTDYAMFLLDTQGHIRTWNPGAERIKGYRAEEIIGQHFSRFYPPEDIQAGKPDRELVEAAATGKYEEEGWRVRKDGSRFWASVLITALFDEAGQQHGFSKITRDLTERKRAEEAKRKLAEERAARQAAEEGAQAVREQREWLRVTLDSIGDAVITTDTNGHVTYLNPVARGLTGWSQEEAQGQPLERVFPILHESTGEPVENPVARVLRDGVTVGLGNHTVLVDRDGTARPINDSAAPIRSDGKILGVVLTFRDVTEERQAQLALQQSEARKSAMLANALDCIISIDHEGRIVEFNPAAERTFGFARAEVLGQQMADLLVPPSLRERHRQGLAHYLATGEGPVLNRRIEMPALRADGSEFLAELAITHIAVEQPPIFTAYLRDITDRTRREQTTRFLADASAALAAVVDYKSTLQKVARLAVPFFADWCAIDMLGDKSTLVRLAVAHVDPAKVQLAHELLERFPPDPEAPQGVWHMLRTGQAELMPEIPDALLVARIPDPDLLSIVRELGVHSYIGVPINSRGKVIGVITFVAAESRRRYDASDLAVAEDLAHRAGVAVDNANLYQALREADRRKDEFLAMLAHELRNPLAPIRNALHILKMPEADTATMHRAREMAERQVHHLTRLVDDLLDVSRIMRGRIELRKERIELASIISRAVETARPLIDAEGHALTVTMPSEAIWLEADLVRMSQVVANLLNNAAKYTTGKGRIWLTAERNDRHVVVRVRDTGIGLAPESLSRIFDLFMQADPSHVRSQGGLGIGLTLVKNLVELHHGTVEAHSPGRGHGSEFIIRLPVSAAGKTPAVAAERPAPAATRHRRILVVDDNVDAAESLSLLLGLEGHHVRVAHGGVAAVDAARAEMPELVFLDIGMPELDGYEVARRLRTLPGGDGLLLIALTGWGQEQDRQRSRLAGFDYHLVKPVDPERLHEVLHKAAGERWT